MASGSPTILPLPIDVAAEIKSSTAIISLTGVVLHLFRNSLDASASKIDIIVDYPRGGCTVEDNGHGIPPAEFRSDGGLGKMHYTSRYNSPTVTHGQAGKFLASLATLALVTITSHHNQHRSHNSLVMHHSKPIARLVPAPAHHHLIAQEHGTRVVVQDLFGSMPVRVKQRAVTFRSLPASGKEWDLLKRGIVGLLLGWDKSVEVVVRDATRNKKLAIAGQGINRAAVALSEEGKRDVAAKALNLKSIRNILSQAGYISPNNRDSWISSSARSSLVNVQGAISLDPAPTKRIQFISCGICPVTAEANNELYDEVNRLFAASSFGVVEEGADVYNCDGGKSSKDTLDDSRVYTQKHQKGGRKGVDKWPMFFLRIDVNRSETGPQMFNDNSLDNENLLGAILEVLNALITALLKEHHFRPQHTGKRHTAMLTVNNSSSTKKGNIAALPPEKPPPAGRGGSLSIDCAQKGDGALGLPSVTTDQFMPKSASAPRSKPSVSHKADFTPPQPDSLRNASSGPHTSINSWRRVKSGKQGFLDDLYSMTPKPSPPPPMPKPSSIPAHVPPCTPQTIEISASEAISQSSSYERVAKDSIIDVRPTLSSIGDSEQHNGRLPVATESLNLHVADEIIPWTNPVSKTTLLINSRTGLAVTPSLRHDSSLSPSSRLSSTARSTASSWPNKRPRLSQNPKFTDSNNLAGGWIGSVLKDWKNPVFRPTEEPIRRVPSFDISQESSGRKHHCASRSFGTGTQDTSASKTERLSKEGLSNAEVIAQVDNKFILVSMRAVDMSENADSTDESFSKTLVLIDQHAADERCRIEALFEQMCAPSTQGMACREMTTEMMSATRVRTMNLDSPIKFQTSEEEFRLLRLYAEHFAEWGVLYTVLEGENTKKSEGLVSVKALPPSIAERCKTEPRLLIELMRTEIWKRNEIGTTPRTNNKQISEVLGNSEGSPKAWLTRLQNCPSGIIEMLNSRACRSAIMFNDVLSLEECKSLVSRLAKCAFPFQCAHGRPSMIPLIELEGIVLGNDESPLSFFQSSNQRGRAEESFAERCMQWRDSMVDSKGGGAT